MLSNFNHTSFPEFLQVGFEPPKTTFGNKWSRFFTGPTNSITILQGNKRHWFQPGKSSSIGVILSSPVSWLMESHSLYTSPMTPLPKQQRFIKHLLKVTCYKQTSLNTPDTYMHTSGFDEWLGFCFKLLLLPKMDRLRTVGSNARVTSHCKHMHKSNNSCMTVLTTSALDLPYIWSDFSRK